MMMMTMESTVATSQEIRDRGSTFVGSIYRANTVDEAKGLLREIKRDGNERKEGRDKRGDAYTIAAWRCMVVKPGRTGLGGPDEFEVGEGWEDGGERWAGKRALGVVQREGVMDAVVVVRRWFGGTLLGPARFEHVETCASEVCRRFKRMEEMEECMRTLSTLDDLLRSLRTRLATQRAKALQDSNPGAEPRSAALPSSEEAGSAGAKHKAPDYRAMRQALDLTKAKRLIHARECAINNTKTLINKYDASK